jgi:hypothetical protein
MKTHHNPGPMDAPPGLLEYAAGEDFTMVPVPPHKVHDCGCGKPWQDDGACPCACHSPEGRVKFGPGWGPPQYLLTTKETEVAAACIAAVLEDYERMDPACPLWVVTQEYTGTGFYGRRLDHLDPQATDARVAAARSALEKMRGQVAA